LLCLCGQSRAETQTGPCPEAAPATPGRRPAVVLPSSFLSGAKVASPQPRSGPPRRLPHPGSGGDRGGRHPCLHRGWGGRFPLTVSTPHRVSSMPHNIRRLHMWHNVLRLLNRPQTYGFQAQLLSRLKAGSQAPPAIRPVGTKAAKAAGASNFLVNGWLPPQTRTNPPFCRVAFSRPPPATVCVSATWKNASRRTKTQRRRSGGRAS
jgi:hypothetical protein